MPINFHHVVLGVIVIVAVGTVAYTLWSSNRTKQQHHYKGSDDDSYAAYNFPNARDDKTTDCISQRRRRKARNSETCTICLTTLSDNLKTLRCSHVFHSYCINAWIKENNTCPVCRATQQ